MTESVNHPAYYQAGGLEVIDIIEAFTLGFHTGNAVKYILRAGRKGDFVEDLGKARWYLDRLLSDDLPQPDSPAVRIETEDVAKGIWLSKEQTARLKRGLAWLLGPDQHLEDRMSGHTLEMKSAIAEVRRLRDALP